MSRWLASFVLALVLAGGALAQPERPPAIAKAGKAAKAAVAFSPERESAGLAFARKHHEALVPLLEALKGRNATAYRQAVVDLSLAGDRLALLRQRDPKRYEVELAAWKARSRVEVLSARMASRPSASAEAELKEAIGRQVDAERARLKAERDEVAARLARLNEQLERLERDRDRAVEAKFKKLADRGKKARKARADAAAAKAKAKAGGGADKQDKPGD